MEPYTDQNSAIFYDAAPVIYAGFWRRVAAYLIDAIILGFAAYFIALLVGYSMFEYRYSSNPFDRFFTFAYMRYTFFTWIINWLYFALQESGAAQATIGKRALGIKVVGPEGGRISFLNATGRYFGKIISGLILCIGFLMVAWDRRKQGLHDKMANTFVVKI